MKRYAVMIFAGMAILSSCNKELLPDCGKDDNLVLTSFTITTQESAIVQTRGEARGTGDDDFIDRLDIIEYDNTGNISDHVFYADPSGINLADITYTKYHHYRDYHYYFFLANLSEEAAEYLTSLNADAIYNSFSGRLPLEDKHFRLHKWLMGGTCKGNFEKDESREVTLFRYVTKFEIGTITAAFDDPTLMSADVVVKSVSLTNVPNALRLLGRHPRNFYGGTQDIYGTGYSYPSNWEGHAFGGVKGGDLSSNNLEENGSITYTDNFSLSSYGATGYLAGSFPYVKNNNKLLAAGELNIDATGDMLTATYIPVSNIAICSSSGTATNPISINQQLYTHPLRRTSYTPVLAKQWEWQDVIQHLVIETTINGEPSFYIIEIRELLPNTVYRINNITLKGKGSPYSNIYINTYETKVSSVSIVDEGAVEIENINIGVNETDGVLYE